MRYRKNPQTGELESNTVLSRWSDGSYTISIGDKSYSLMSKQLAPPIGPDGKDYQDVLDSHTYLATPYMDSEVFHIVGHMTNQFTVDANQEVQDHALERLKAGMAAAARGTNKDDNKGGLALINTSQDPELQKKQAEMAEKERAKAQRRRETAALRADQQAGRIRGSLGGGLTLDDLEKGGSRGLGSAKKKRSAPSGPKRARRRPDYDSDDDLPAGRRGKEDEYDLEDDFLAPSDEEEEAEEDDEESEEEVDEGSEGEREPKKRKVEQDADADGESDPDADGEVDDTGAGGGNGATGEAAAAAARARKRHVIEDDEDE
jgi:RNA polymerase-associated protein LEO1